MPDINEMIRENLGQTESIGEKASPVPADVEDYDLVLDIDDDYAGASVLAKTAMEPDEADESEEDPNEDEKIGDDIEIDNSVYIEGYIDEEKARKNKKINILLWVLTLITAALTALAIKTMFIATIYVPSQSMEPTIRKGEIVLGNSIDVLDMNIQRGDIVIFRYPKQIYKKYIKRIIGLPGDRVVIAQNRIYINDEVYPLDEPYVKADTWSEDVISSDNVKVYNVPAGEYFVLGDNRDNSEDSRYWGYLPGSYINAKGKYVIHSLWPFSAQKL